MTLNASRQQAVYSPALRAGNLLFVSGQVPRNPLDRTLIGSNIVEQAHAVMRNLSAVLAGEQADLGQLVKVNVYLADIGQIQEFNEVYRSYFSGRLPTRTAVGAALNGVLVEVDAIAYLQSGSGI